MNLKSTIMVLSCASVVLIGTFVWHPGAFSQPRPAPVTRTQPDHAMPLHVTTTRPHARETIRTPATVASAAPQLASSSDDSVEDDIEAPAAVDPRKHEVERLAYAER